MQSKSIHKKQVLVSNPGKQYTHQLLYALQRNNWSHIFITSFWYKPAKFPFTLLRFLPGRIKNVLKKELGKRYFDKIDSDNVRQFPWFEFIREVSDKLFSQRFAERMQYYRDRVHDRYTASKLRHYSPGIVIGYEESCLHTFRKAKENGIVTVLDLAQIHYKEITAISQKHEVFGDLFKDQILREKINSIKEQELSLADYIICLSQFAKDSLIKNGVAEEKIFVANLGFDPYSFTPKNAYSKEGKLQIVFAGTMTRRKGVDLLFLLKEQLNDKIDLTFIGPMADASDLFVKYKGRYTWHSYVSHKEMNSLFNKADLFVFPSYLDSWAMVVIEAMATGLPVIVSDNTGAKDAVDIDAGFCVPAGDINSLKEKILYFYNSREELQLKGKKAREKAMEYTWENYYSIIDSIIRSVNWTNRKVI